MFVMWSMCGAVGGLLERNIFFYDLFNDQYKPETVEQIITLCLCLPV